MFEPYTFHNFSYVLCTYVGQSVKAVASQQSDTQPIPVTVTQQQADNDAMSTNGKQLDLFTKIILYSAKFDGGKLWQK